MCFLPGDTTTFQDRIKRCRGQRFRQMASCDTPACSLTQDGCMPALQAGTLPSALPSSGPPSFVPPHCFASVNWNLEPLYSGLEPRLKAMGRGVKREGRNTQRPEPIWPGSSCQKPCVGEADQLCLSSQAGSENQVQLQALETAGKPLC